MASLTLRGQTWHICWRWRGKAKTKSTKVRHDGKFKNGKPVPPAAAKRELRAHENAIDQGRSVERKTLSQLLDLVEKEYAVSGYRSAPSLKSRIEHLRGWFGNLRAEMITESDFIEYADHRRQPRGTKPGAKNNTINRELEMLMKALRIGKIHPLPILKKLTAAPPRQGFFDDAKIAAVVKRLPEYLRAPVMFGYYTGWRREEVFGLEWRNVDFTSGEIRLWESKNDQPRVFPMDAVPGLRALLYGLAPSIMGRTNNTAFSVVKMNSVTTQVAPYVFIRKQKSGRIRQRLIDFRKAWATACKNAGCPGMIFHDLRRSAARNLELTGWPRAMIMQWMGHETESMFYRYRIVSAADREIVSNMLAKRKEAGGNG